MTKRLLRNIADPVIFKDGTNATDGTFLDEKGIKQEAYGFIVKVEGDYSVQTFEGDWLTVPFSKGVLPFHFYGVRNVGDTTTSSLTADQLIILWG